MSALAVSYHEKALYKCPVINFLFFHYQTYQQVHVTKGYY